MLARILEPEFMDTPEEAQDYDSMDHAEVNRRFVDDLLAALAACRLRPTAYKTFRLLDLGTGTAQIPIELCRRAEWIKVVAVDAAVHMLGLAQRNIESAGLSNRIQVQQGDAKKVSDTFSRAKFDGVISNSIIHHLPEPILCLKEAQRVCRPGGLFFFRDLMRPQSENELTHLVNLYAPLAGASPAKDHQRAMLADSLHAALTLDEIRQLAIKLGFPAESVQPTSDRHWTLISGQREGEAPVEPTGRP
jgi:ubiquinone/menaquinone biosynthesis C-methylase UbiE